MATASHGTVTAPRFATSRGVEASRGAYVVRRAVVFISVFMLVVLAASPGVVSLARPAPVASGTFVWKHVLDPSTTRDCLDRCASGPGGAMYASGTTGSWPDGSIWVTKYAPNGTRAWAATWDGPDGVHDQANDIIVDAAGNVYVCGLTVRTGAISDSVVVKYDADGKFQWATVYVASGVYSDRAEAIAIAPDGDLLVGGSARTSSLSAAIYTAKFRASTGARVWESFYPREVNCGVTDMAVTRAGDCYVAGYSGADYNARDGVLIKTTAAGTVAWSQAWNSSGSQSDYWTSVELARTGDGVIVAGATDVTGPGDAVAAQYSSEGARVWVRTWSSSGSRSERTEDLAVAGDGSVWVCGTTMPTSGSTRGFVVKWSWRGTRRFARVVGTDAQPAGLESICVDALGGAYVGGWLWRTSRGGSDAMATRLTASGGHSWTSAVGFGPGSGDYLLAIVLGPSGYLYASGVASPSNDEKGIVVKIRR